MSEASNERCPGYSEFIDVTAQLGSIYLAKNHDYGNSFEKGMDTMGDVYAISRIFDKTNRLVELSKKDVVSKVPEETIIDTLKDLANYAIMTIMYKQKHHE